MGGQPVAATRRCSLPGLLPPSLRAYRLAWLGPDLLAGVTLAAVAIPECMGYAKIAGTPIVSGLYSILLPLAAFALVGSSRHLVVGADSATAAMLFAGLTGLAQPGSPRWLTLASASALLTALMLLLARALRLGFLADFLSQTVLVGFLSGVGVSLMIGQLPDMLGIAVSGHGTLHLGLATLRGLAGTRVGTLFMAIAVIAVTIITGRVVKRVPGALLAVVLAIAATWFFRLDQHGIVVVGRMTAGLPTLGIPRPPLADLPRLLAITLSMFLVIIAQSAATARSFAEKRNEPLDENRDVVALGIANAFAGCSSSFVVNGSPSKTAVVVSAGGRTQVAQLSTAGVVLLVVLFATALIERLPEAALAAIVFLIGIQLIELSMLRRIYHFRKVTFAVAMAALLGVVIFGVETGILLAIVLSILDHLRQEYRPRDVVLVLTGANGGVVPADPGVESEPGMIVYRFEAPLFFANADYFRSRIRDVLAAAPHPVQVLVLDLVSMSDIDFTAGLKLAALIRELRQRDISVVLAQAADVRAELDRAGISPLVGPAAIFDTMPEAIAAWQTRTVAALSAKRR